MHSSYTNTQTSALEPLEWDSNFLGFGVARVRANSLGADELRKLIAAASQSNLKLLYLLASPGDALSNASARQAGALLADRKVTFLMEVPTTAGEELNPAIRPTTSLTSTLESLALQSGEYSRFRLDPNFAPPVYAELYGLWLHNSLSHEFAREVLVFESGTHAKDELGFITLGIKQGRVDIGLLAVDEQARGQRIGQQLVQAAQQRAASWGFRQLQVVTQLDNERACRFYRNCGFREETVEHIYHVWL